MLIFTEKNKLAMLKRANFTIKFSIDGIDMQEEYSLSYRTEEWDNLLDNERLNPSLTHIQQAKQYIAKDLGVRRYWVTVNNICKTHNHLIIE
jgi:hypothetical protein